MFPRGYVLAGQTTAIVRTGKNRNRAQTLYWNQRNYIWNNTGDTARFQTPAGKTFDTCTYKAVTGRARVAAEYRVKHHLGRVEADGGAVGQEVSVQVWPGRPVSGLTTPPGHQPWTDTSCPAARLPRGPGRTVRVAG